MSTTDEDTTTIDSLASKLPPPDKKCPKCRTSNFFIFGGFAVLISGLIALITLSALNYNNYYNTLICDIYDVTPVDSTTDYTIEYYFQYSYSGQGCEESSIYTIWNSNYFDAIESRDRIANTTTAPCYAEKHTNQCDCYMNPPQSSGFFMGIFLGSLGLLISIIVSSCVFCVRFCD
jgi:hypothetical protein